LAAVAVAATSLVSPAAHASPGPTPTLVGPNVVDYRVGFQQYPLRNNHQELRQGTAVAGGGCQFSGTSVLRKGAPPLTEVELAYDPDTCRDLVDIGTLVTPRTPSAATGMATDQRTLALSSAPGQLAIPASSGGFGTNTAVPGAPYSNSADRSYMDSWFDEPARWATGTSLYNVIPPVNEQLNFIEWSPGGGCPVGPGTTGWFGYWQQWLTYTGWSRESNDWQHPSSFPCGQQDFSTSTVHFRNRAFCAFVAENVPIIGPILGPVVGVFFPTDVYYQPNNIQGNIDGSYNWNWTVSKSGPCSGLLRDMHTNAYY
jgi:hypothetical protein